MRDTEARPHISLTLESFTPQAFAPFGTVTQNPAKYPEDWHTEPERVHANQGSATKYLNVSHLTNSYGVAPSSKPAQPAISMFVCKPRSMASGPTSTTKKLLVPLLERHPYTTQTFVPVGLSPGDTATAYLVIVAPTLPSSGIAGPPRPSPYPVATPPRRKERPRSRLSQLFFRARPEPFTNSYQPCASSSNSSADSTISIPSDTRDHSSPNHLSDFRHGPTLRSSFSSLAEYAESPSPLTRTLFAPRGTGGPDLANARAFLCHGGQSVTYAPGTWHAPMIVVGAQDVDFVVMQWTNGVHTEDCQEIELSAAGKSLEIMVDESKYGYVPEISSGAGEGEIKAKL